METNQLEVLARIVLPSEILDYFSIVSVEESSSEIHIHLDELMNTELSNDIHFESKGFMSPVNVTDFPIRDHKVILVIRRRRWTDLRTGKSFSLPITLDVACQGTRYSKEFGAFLKETYGDICIKTINLGHIATYIFQNAQLQPSCIHFTLFLHK